MSLGCHRVVAPTPSDRECPLSRDLFTRKWALFEWGLVGEEAGGALERPEGALAGGLAVVRPGRIGAVFADAAAEVTVGEEPVVALGEHLFVRPARLPAELLAGVLDVEPHRLRVHDPVVRGEGG